jgi:hypothetical protein
LSPLRAQLPAAIGGIELLDAEVEEFRGSLHLRALSEGEGILYVDAEIANGALNLSMAEKDLDSAQVARLLVDDGRLSSAQRMRAVILPAQPKSRSPTHRRVEHIVGC